MATYALLKNPRYTQVSFKDFDMLMHTELFIVCTKLSNPIEHIRNEVIGGLSYVLFDTASLNEEDIKLLSRLSFIYALFEIMGKLFLPITKNPDYFLGEDLSGILKYLGKTNELFTRLMLNLATVHITESAPLNILDPLAGKATTLFESLMQKHNAYGIEIDLKVAQESNTYLKKYLETAKYKHTTHAERVTVQAEGQRFTATRYQIDAAPNKQLEKQGETRHFEIVAGDTRYATSYFKKNFFDAIIADLPYGIQHGSFSVKNSRGSRNSKKSSNVGITRNPLELLAESLPEWVKILKPKGVIVLAWNHFIVSRDEIKDVLKQNGLSIPDIYKDFNFLHRVDQAIERDLIIVSTHS